jgi:hypothetical protein
MGYFGLELLMNPTYQKPDTLWTACKAILWGLGEVPKNKKGQPLLL